MIRIEKNYDGTVTPQPSPAAHGEGPVMTDEAYEQQLAAIAANPVLQGDNVRLPESAGAGLRGGLLFVGVICLALTALGAVIHSPTHALASFEVAVFTVLAICLGSLFYTMLFQALNAYWPVTMRRQLEHAAGLVWLPLLGMVAVILIELVSNIFTGHGVLFQWLTEDTGHLLEHKEGYLNLGFLLVRFAIYGGIWLFLARSILSMSLEQDATGNRMLTRAIRRRASWGLLAFALSVAFASFDFLMSLDYRFYSTMWGVYFFAGAAMSALAVTTIIFSVLRLTGRLTGVVTDEHYHDLGKLLFAFGACFWAYIAFSQYFLIWYGNIPEESAFYVYRQQGGWQYLSMILVIGHFFIPFMILISRKVKRNVLLAAIMAAYLLVFQVLDLTWIIRPMAYVGAETIPGPGSWWIDVVASVGGLALFTSFLMRALASAPLIPMKDPRLASTLSHKNYV